MQYIKNLNNNISIKKQKKQIIFQYKSIIKRKTINKKTIKKQKKNEFIFF